MITYIYLYLIIYIYTSEKRLKHDKLYNLRCLKKMLTSRDLKQSLCVKTPHRADKSLMWMPLQDSDVDAPSGLWYSGSQLRAVGCLREKNKFYIFFIHFLEDSNYI